VVADRSVVRDGVQLWAHPGNIKQQPEQLLISVDQDIIFG